MRCIVAPSVAASIGPEQALSTTDGGTPQTALRRDIGAGGVSLVVLNGMIGAGIFALPAAVAARAGTISPWLFVLIGLLFIIIVLSFAELSSYFRKTGGPVLYTTTAFGAPVGFCTGWSLYVSRMTAFAANSVAMATYAGAIWPALQSPTAKALFASIIIIGLTTANYFGVRDGIRTVAMFTVLKLVPMLVLVLVGLKEVTGDILLPTAFPDIDDFGGLILLVVYAFVGFESATVVTGETREPRRTVPRVMLFTVLATAALYALIVLVFIAVLGDDSPEGKTLVDTGRGLAGAAGALIIGLAAIFSIGGNLSASMVTVPRITYAMAEQTMLPRWFGKVHERFASPANSILLLGGLAFVFALTGSFEILAIASSVTRLISYILCIAAIPFVRRRATDEQLERAFRPPLANVIHVTSLVICVWMASQASLAAWKMTALLFAIGLALYLLARYAAHSDTSTKHA